MSNVFLEIINMSITAGFVILAVICIRFFLKKLLRSTPICCGV